jgi:hypothetical protein
MVVHNLDIVSVSIAPPETNSPLVVDTNAEFTFSTAGEFFQPVPGGGSKIV